MMRFGLLFLLSWLLPVAGAWAQAESIVVQRANELIAQRKYESAFILLQNFDPEHKRPAVALKAAELALQYHSRHLNYRRFAFRNLSLTQPLDSIRVLARTDTLAFFFPVRTILEGLYQKHPDNYRLDKGLADYYFEVQQCGCAEPGRTEDNLFPLMVQHYEAAHKHGYGDYLSYYALGYAYMRLGQFKASAAAFEHTISLRKNYALAHFNLAYDYIELHQLPKARHEAQLAVAQFTEPQFKSDAQYMLENLERRIAKLKAEAAAAKAATAKKKTSTKATAARKTKPSKKPIPKIAPMPRPAALPDSLPVAPAPTDTLRSAARPE